MNDLRSMNILITGAHSLIARHLTPLLEAKGHTVLLLGRKKTGAPNSYAWDPEKKQIDQEAVERADVILHLAGAGIGDKRWTKKRKAEIIRSRVGSAALLADAVRKRNRPLDLLISASGMHYYGMITSEKIFTETDPPGHDFLADCCAQWEAAAQTIPAGRTVIFRISAVLARDGGAFPKLAQPVRWGLGVAFASGKQWLPWIHIDDCCRLLLHAIESPALKGACNVAAPEQVNNKAFMRALSKKMRRPFWLPNIPRFVLRIMLGELEGLVTQGSRVSAEKILSSGFVFRFPTLDTALEDLK